MIVDRVARFVADRTSGDFGSLALEAFAFQYERVAPYRRLCAARGAGPGSIGGWREIPAVPALAFKSQALAAAEARVVFRSSGTTGRERSVHHQPYPDLYRAAIDHSFPGACLRGGERPPMLSFVPGLEQAPDSSLAFMVDHVLRRFGGDGSATAYGRRGVEIPRARSWLAARQRDRRPALLLATSFALAQLLDGLDRLALSFRLPAGSAVFDTGGMKGRRRELSRPKLLERLGERLGIAPGSVVREYGMTELTSQCYAGALAGAFAGGDPDLFRPPHWMRVRIVDPLSLAEAAPAERGLVCVFDLANIGSAVHLLTEDLGVAEDGGFRLAGRAAGADLRGCSLMVEELEEAG